MNPEGLTAENLQDTLHGERPGVFVTAAWHSLACLAAANLVGVLLATLLLFPGIEQLARGVDVRPLDAGAH